jgi:hypothetical protein
MASRPGTAASAALGAHVRRIVTFAWLDLAGEPLRLTDAPYPVSFTGTGDEDLDGFTFAAVDARLVVVGPVKAQEGGSDTVTLTLSGLAGVDDDVMTEIGDRTNWAGRDARLWRMMLDPDTLAPIGAPWSYYTGYMNVPKITGDRSQQTVQLEVESYIGFFTQASNRGYLGLSNFDVDDHSAALAVAIANGAGNRK